MRSAPLARWLLAAVITVMVGAAMPAGVLGAQQVHREAGPNDVVRTMSGPHANGLIYLGGDFTRFDTWLTGGFAAVSPARGTVDASFPPIHGQISAIVPDGTGGVFVGGSFSCVGYDPTGTNACTDPGEYPRENLVHVMADGAIDTEWAPEPDGAVSNLLLGDSGLYVAGTFRTIGGESRDGLARVSTSGTGVADAWDPQITWEPTPGNVFPGQVSRMALSGSTVYIAGQFDTIGGQTRLGLGAVDTGTGAATGWNPVVAQSRVEAMAAAGPTVYLAGSFTEVGGQPRSYLAAVDGTSGALTPWNPAPNDRVGAITVAGSSVYATGDFTRIGGIDRPRLARLSTVDATTDAGWTPDLPEVVTMVPAGDYVYLGGAFGGGAGRMADTAVRVSAADGARDTSWTPDPATPESRPFFRVGTILVTSSHVLIGGDFASLGGIARSHAAAMDAQGHLAAWDPAPDAPVTAIAPAGPAVFIGGEFSTVGGKPRVGVAKVAAAGAGAVDETWRVDVGTQVNALLPDGASLFVGGALSGAGGTPLGSLARIGTAGAGAVDGQWAPDLPFQVAALAMSGGHVYAAGTDFGGPRLARVDQSGTGRIDDAWRPDIGSGFRISAIVARDDQVYVGGLFWTMAGRSRANLAAFSMDPGARLADWAPQADGPVFALAGSDRGIFAGGMFSRIGTKSRKQVALLDAGGTGVARAGWRPDPDGQILALAPAGDSLFLGGYFSSMEEAPPGTPITRLARTNAAGEPEQMPLFTPGAPRAAVAEAGNGTATVSWDPPVAEGGSAVRSYTVQVVGGDASCRSAATTCTVSGLTNGVPYAFTVSATNDYGTGPLSGASQAVVPRPPAAPTAAPALRAMVRLSRSRVVSGGRLVIAISARNRGGAAAEATRLCVRLPSALRVVGRRTGRDVCFAVGTIPPRASRTASVRVRATASRRSVVRVGGVARARGTAGAQAPRRTLVIIPRRQ